MVRRKLLDGEKKSKIGFTINTELDDIMIEYLKENNISPSKYIENLIKEDMKERGFSIKNDFEK